MHEHISEHLNTWTFVSFSILTRDSAEEMFWWVITGYMFESSIEQFRSGQKKKHLAKLFKIKENKSSEFNICLFFLSSLICAVGGRRESVNSGH